MALNSYITRGKVSNQLITYAGNKKLEISLSEQISKKKEVNDKDKYTNKQKTDNRKKLTKTKPGSLKRLTKLRKSYTGKKKEKIHILDFKNERRVITTESINIKRGYYEPLYTNKFNNSDERDKFL